MKEEFGNDFIVITDEDGNEFEIEHIDTIEIDNQLYMAFLPANMDEEHEDFGILIFKVLEEDGEEVLASIDDEEELNSVYLKFKEMYNEFSDENSEEEE